MVGLTFQKALKRRISGTEVVQESPYILFPSVSAL